MLIPNRKYSSRPLFVAAKEFVDGLLTPAAAEQPSDEFTKEELVMELPKDYDEKKFNRYSYFCRLWRYNKVHLIFYGVC